MRICGTIALFVVSILAVPGAVFAQAIAGTVHDISGAALPNVAVQARSGALIERVRVGVTDGTGQYRIEALRPGLYMVTFSLQGFTTEALTAIQVISAFTTTVNARLAPSAVSEVVTVTADTPVVDVRGPAATTLRGDLVASLPTVRSYNALVALIPGITTSTNDIVTGTATTQFPIHGGRANEGRVSLDGLTVGGPSVGNSATSYVVDAGVADEVTFTGPGGQGDNETGGLVVNLVPRTGGNTARGSLFASGTGEKFEAASLTQSPLSKVYDVSGTIGGRIVTDRLWYFLTAHRGGSTMQSTNVFYNLNAGDPSKWLYAPDPSRREYSDRLYENASARLTWQVTPRNKVGMFWDWQSLCRTCTGATPAGIDPARVSPEAVGVFGRPLDVMQATWASPVTNHLLIDAGFSGIYSGFGNYERTPNPTRDLIRVVEQCASGCAANGGIPGLAYRSQDFSDAYNGSYLWKTSVSHVTGSHSLKAGYQHTLMTMDSAYVTNTQNLTYRVNNGVPNQLTQSISPWVNSSRTGWDAIFMQEQWTRDRLTLRGALRFDRVSSWFPETQEGPSRFLPAPLVIPSTSGVDSYKDITSRFGAAYDVFGNGRTALKVHMGRYLDGAGTAGVYLTSSPTQRMPQTTPTNGPLGVSRTWTDANGNFAPDCNLADPNVQDLRASGGDFCGSLSNMDFGRNMLTNNFDPGVLNGWGVRPSDWTLDLAVQQQISRHASASVNFTRRWFQGFVVADNLALQSSDLTPFSVTAPLDSRLPGGGGYLVGGLYDVVPGKSGQVSNLIADSRAYGNWYQYFNGVDATVNLHASNVTFVGGVSAGQTIADNCDVRAHLPELATTTTGTSALGAGNASSTVSPLSPYCRVAYGLQAQFRGLGSYDVPGINIRASATMQSKPGAMLAANYVVPNAAVVQSIGRNLSGNAPNVTVNLIAPGQLYGDRINELDLRLAKLVKSGRLRTMVALDVYNALNSSAVLSYNSAFVPNGSWLQPLAVLTPRFFKLTAEVEF